MTQANALLIFIKNPELGKAKTRLAATVGDERALAIYKELLRHTRKIATATPADRLLFYSQFIDKSDEWPNELFQKQLQIQGGLGHKMQTAFEFAFQEHDKVVIVGSDCASLTPEIVATAFQKLDDVPFVIGPAKDGGYYLLGMRNFSPTIFDDIVWSTESVLADTLERIKALNASYYLLAELSDIDYWEDWQQYGWDF